MMLEVQRVGTCEEGMCREGGGKCKCCKHLCLTQTMRVRNLLYQSRG
jgi:hypothetical protein